MYGAKVKYADVPDEADRIGPKQVNIVQKILECYCTI